MEHLSNGFTLELSAGAFPLSTDSIALAGFIKLPKNAKVLDLGAGCGTLGLLLCAQDAGCKITGVEIDPDAHQMALKNAADNGIADRFSSICADMSTIPSLLEPCSFQVCISNPPYFTGGPVSQATPAARQELSCSLETVFSGAGYALQYGGDFFLVHKPERFAQICALGAKYHLEPKRLQLLRHKENGPVSLILVQCRKGAKPGLIWEEQFLRRADGSDSDYYRRLYHL